MKRIILLVLIFFFVLVSTTSANTVKIGVIWPLTGTAAAEGRELRAGAELAKAISDGKYQGLGILQKRNVTVELIFKDHEGNPTLGGDLAKKLILDDKVAGILGCYHSSVTKVVSTLCEQYGIPMINSDSSSPSLTRRDFKWFWRISPHDEVFITDLFEFLDGIHTGRAKGLGKQKKLNGLASACEQTEWGSSVSEIIRKFAPIYGYEIKKSFLHASSAPDFSTEVRSMKASKAEVALFSSYTTDAIHIVKTMKDMKYSPKIVWGNEAGFGAPEFVSTLGDNCVGILTRNMFLPKIAQVKKVSSMVNEIYKKNIGHDLTGAGARAFTGVQLWIEILEKAKSTDPKVLQKTIDEIHIPGDQLIVPWGGIKFKLDEKDMFSDESKLCERLCLEDTNQNQFGTGVIAQYQKGQKGIELEIVYPFKAATSNVIFPFRGF